jgi:hypothetical protein
MGFASFGPLTTFCLSLGRLPAAHELQAFRLLAVPLVPTPGPVNAAAPSTQAHPEAKPATSRRNWPTESMLEISQGRCMLPKVGRTLAAAFCTAAGTPLVLRGCMDFPSLRPAPPFFLPLGRLPTAHEPQAFRVLTVPLVPMPRLVSTATPSTQAGPPAKTPGSGRKQLTETMLEMSQGRCLLPKGPPERLL